MPGLLTIVPLAGSLLTGSLLADSLSAGSPSGDISLSHQRSTFCVDSQRSTCPTAPLVEVATPAPSSVWKFSRTVGPKDGDSFAAITKTADTAQSDPDFAGLIIRCAPKGKVEVLVAVIRPFPPRSHPKVTIAASTAGTLTVEASMAAAGAAVLLPDEVSAFAAGKWQTTPSLSLVVKEGDSEIKGTVALNGLRESYNSLLANCGQ